MTWAIVQWSPARFVRVEQLDEELEATPPDLVLTPGIDDGGRPGVWSFLSRPDVTVGFPDEPSACRYVHEHGIGTGTATRAESGLLDDHCLVTDDVDAWVELATFVYDVRDDAA